MTAALGIAAVVMVLLRMLFQPGPNELIDLKFGILLALIAAVVVAYGRLGEHEGGGHHLRRGAGPAAGSLRRLAGGSAPRRRQSRRHPPPPETQPRREPSARRPACTP